MIGHLIQTNFLCDFRTFYVVLHTDMMLIWERELELSCIIQRISQMLICIHKSDTTFRNIPLTSSVPTGLYREIQYNCRFQFTHSFSTKLLYFRSNKRDNMCLDSSFSKLVSETLLWKLSMVSDCHVNNLQRRVNSFSCWNILETDCMIRHLNIQSSWLL